MRAPGRRRAWLVLASMFLPVVLVFATPVHASAVVVNSNTWNKATWKLEHAAASLNDSLGTVDCELANIRYTADGNGVEWKNGECFGIVDFSPFAAQMGEAGSGFRLSFQGSLADGSQDCSGAVVDALSSHASDGFTVAGTIPAYWTPFQTTFGATITDGSCIITSVCLEFSENTAAAQCDSVSMGAPYKAVKSELPASTECEHFAPAQVTVTKSKINPNTGAVDQYNRVWFTVTMDGTRKTSDAALYATVVFSPGANNFGHGTFARPLLGQVSTSVTASGFIGQYVTNHPYSELGGYDAVTARAVSMMSAPYYINASSAQKLLGHKLMWERNVDEKVFTDARNCRWYVGDNLDPTVPGQEFVGVSTARDDGNNVVTSGTAGTGSHGPFAGDEPAPPEQTENAPRTVEPTPTVETESGFWAAVLRLLQGIWGAISQIPSAILDGLSGLFVPSDGYLNARVGEVRSMWDDTAPVKYLNGFSSLVPGEVQGCEGIPFRFDMPGVGASGVSVGTKYIGAACTGNMADVAGLVRVGISAAVVVGGGLACVRGLGSGFGWNPNVGGSTGA